MRFFTAVMIVLIFAGCTTTAEHAHKHEEFTKHYKDSLFKVTEKGMYSIEMVVKEHELVTGINEIDVIVHEKDDKDAVGAEVTVTPWMPEMGHGVFEDPVITERGGGLYSVENIILIMGGHWELRVKVKTDDMEDSAVFDFPDVKTEKGHKHEITTTRAPSDLDLSTEKLTNNKMFNISYRSDPEVVPINKFIIWTLTLNTADGLPVTDAVISVDGDMPEHGHGLPTRPEVTLDLGKGEYLLEGLKFSMPGWWIMEFNIKTQEGEDSVTFNLLLKE
jgi:hypothetical protein